MSATKQQRFIAPKKFILLQHDESQSHQKENFESKIAENQHAEIGKLRHDARLEEAAAQLRISNPE